MITIRYYYISRKMIYFLITAILLLVTILALIYFDKLSNHTSKLVMGSALYKQELMVEPNVKALPKPDLEAYSRPSKLPMLNTRIYSIEFNYQGDGDNPVTPEKSKIPQEYFKSPDETIINYFSILRDAENLTKEKMGGCGTVGASKYPFPIAYSFLTPEFQKKVDYRQYIKSYEGIAHTSLIKLRLLPPDLIHPRDIRYFVEIETIEGSDKGVTYFAYYYGYIYIQKQEEKYLISDLQLYGEDFLCAPMHGWYHNAEANVSIRYGNWCKMIDVQYPTKQEDYVKRIYFKGTDGSDYMIEFIHLTNDTDVEVAQYKKADDGAWYTVYLKPEKCLEKKKD